MVKVQAAEDGALGGGRSKFRFVYKDTIFTLPAGVEVAEWMVVVPDDTPEDAPFALERDRKTKKWSIAGAKAAPSQPVALSQLANAEADQLKRTVKAKTADVLA